MGQDSARGAFLGLRTRSLQRFRPYAWIAAGLGLGLISLVYYVVSGYSKTMLWLWLAALVVLAVAFGLRSRALPRIALADVGVAAGLVALAAPLYLLVLERWPVQVSSDEIAVMQVSDEYAHAVNVDPFGVSWYLTRPAGLFIVLRPDNGNDNASGTTTTTTSAGTTTSTTPPARPAPANVRIVVRGGEPVGGIRNVTVSKGRQVVLIVNSDVADEVHLHGYNLKRDVTPGTPARLPFRATINGTVEVELEQRGVPLARITTQP